MLSPFPSSHLSFLPLQSVLYFSVSSSVCPNSQWCFPTFSLSRNTLWRHSLNFPLWFLYCISSEIGFSAIFSWSSLLKSSWEPSILEVGREGAAFPDVLSSLFSPCHPLASLPPPPPVLTEVHFHRQAHSSPSEAGPSCSPPLPVTSLLYVSFTSAGSCSSAVFSICSLKSTFSIFFPRLPSNAFQSLTPCYSHIHWGRCEQLNGFVSPFILIPWGCPLPMPLCSPCILHGCGLSDYKSDRQSTFCRRPRGALFPTQRALAWLPVIFRCFFKL